MTRDEILAKEPGRELNRLVSLHIFKMDKVDYIPYSEQIGPAWEVVEKMREKNWILLHLCHTRAGHWDRFECEFMDPYSGSSRDVIGMTAPEAICKAALIAVLEEVSA